MNYRRMIIGLATAGMAAGLVAAAAPAMANNTNNPTYLVDQEFGFADASGAYNLAASGNLLHISPTKSVFCNDNSPVNSATLATLNAGAVGTVKALKDQCGEVDGDAWSSQ